MRRSPGGCSAGHRPATAVRICSGVAAVWPIDTTTPVAASFSMKAQRPRQLRGQRHDADAAAGGVLPAAELVPIGRPDVGFRMCAARAVLGGDVRPFQVERRNRCGPVPRHCRTVRASVAKPWVRASVARGDQRRAEAAGAVTTGRCRRHGERRPPSAGRN